MRISDWSSDVCSSDLAPRAGAARSRLGRAVYHDPGRLPDLPRPARRRLRPAVGAVPRVRIPARQPRPRQGRPAPRPAGGGGAAGGDAGGAQPVRRGAAAAGPARLRPAAGCRERDWSSEHRSDPAVRAAWVALYRDVEAHWDLYELAEKLVDLEHMLDLWRHHHASTVKRVIGFKPGTGGTSGVGYLRQAVFRRFFPELWECRTEM